MVTPAEKEISRRIYEEYRKEKAGVPAEEILTKEYQIFARTRGIGKGDWYEKLAKQAGRIMKFPVSKAKAQEVNTILASFDYDIEAEDVYSFAIFAFLAVMILGMLMFPISLLMGIVILSFSFFALYYYWTYPEHLASVRRSKAATEIILSVLYIVIYMKNVANLEAAVRFASDNLEGPLGLDYRKILWDVSAKKYSSVQEALNSYLMQWKKYNEAFVDSIYLIETSLVQISDERRTNMLDQALRRILDGTFEIMVHYVNDLRTPVSAIFMLGITLPIMGLVMLPLISAFMANLITSDTLFIFYDIVLPFIVIIMIRQILSTRPSAFPQIDLSKHPFVPPENHFIFQGRAIHAAIPAVASFFLISAPYFWYAIARQQFLKPNENDVLFSLLVILGLGVAISIYCKLASDIRVKIRKEIKEVENDFGYAVFQIGNRLGEGVPAEIALMKTAGIMKQSKVSFFVGRISNNMSKLGMDLKRAIFDKELGAVVLYPSMLIRSVMRIFIEAVRESEEIAAASLMHISSYLQNVHMIEEKIKDVLSETLSTLKFQATFIAPLISGIIVGLTSMIMIILSVLGEKIASATSAADVPSTLAGTGGVGGTMAFGFFEMSNTIPLPVFQIVVGIYLIEITIISAVLASKIEYGDDRVQELDTVAKSLLISTIIYFIVALGVTIAFAGMAKIAITLGEFA